MSLAAAKAQFASDLVDLWDNADENTTIYETGDLIETFWGNSRVTGYEVTSPVVIPGSTYAGLAPLLTYNGTAATAAAAFEAACSTMVVGTLYTIIAPPFTTPPPFPTPAGAAIPGVLTSALTTFFGILSPSSKASAFADLIAAYLGGFSINVTVPPAGAVPVPII
jgi:hypothetical protein